MCCLYALCTKTRPNSPVKIKANMKVTAHHVAM